jgi:hypothetical protein
MKNLKNNIIKILLGILISVSFASCDAGGDPEAGGTTTETYAGDWYVSVTVAGATKLVKFSTYNASANDNTMWVDDNNLSQKLKAKYTINLADGTFASDATTPNLNQTGKTVTITEGKIEKLGGTSKGGHIVDKISFKVVYSGDPTIYTYVGTKRTGFKEDEP